MASRTPEPSSVGRRDDADRFRKIFEHANDAILLLDPDADRIVDANAQACELLGYGVDELLGLRISDVHPGELQALRDFTSSVMQEGVGWTDDLTCLTKGGRRVPAEISASVMAHDGELRLVALVRDVSRLRDERRTLEAAVAQRTRALARSEARLRTLLAVNNAVVSELEPEALFAAVAEALSQVVTYHRVTLLLPSGDAGGDAGGDPGADAGGDATTMVVAGLAGDPKLTRPVPLGTVLAMEDTLLEPLSRDSRPLYVSDLEARSDLRAPLQRLRRSGLAAFVAVPLLHQGRLRGILVMGSRERDPYSGETVELLSEVGEQVAIAVDNMLAYRKIDELRGRLEEEKRFLQEEIESARGPGRFVGESAPVRRALEAAGRVAATDATVLLLGETGTGKELVARRIHEASPRSGEPMVKVNCAALPASLVESELFGHEKGAFTGADQRRPGRFELADGGTLFLDEVGEMPAALQAKLLNVLQDGEVTRVGGVTSVSVDVRLIAATNRDLAAEVEAGRFRADLYYRLNVFPVELPPLRQRRDDIPLLVEHFAAKHGRRQGKVVDEIPRRDLESLAGLAWPGNVRELENLVERAVILSTGRRLEIGPLLAEVEARSAGAAPASLDEAQRRHILKALERTGWKVSGPGGAAEMLEVKPTTLESRMKKLGIERPGS